MGACCTSRDLRLTKPAADTLHLKSQLTEGKEKLTQQYQSLQKLNLHLSRFQQRNGEFKAALRGLKKAKKEYVEQHSKLAESIDLMNSLLSQLDVEVQAQYISERESTDLSKEELYSVIQAVRAQKQAEKLEQLSLSLSSFISYPDKRKEFDLQVEQSLALLKYTSNSLLDFIRYAEKTRSEAMKIIEDVGEITETEANEKLEEKVREWNVLRRGTLKLSDDLEGFMKKLMSSFSAIGEELLALQKEIDEYLEAEMKTQQAVETQNAAQQYLSLLSSERASIPRKSHRNSSGIPSPLIQPSQAGSVIMEEYVGSLRRFCIVNKYRDGAIFSPRETFEELGRLMNAKMKSDVEATKKGEVPITMELFLMEYFLKGASDKKEGIETILKFTGGLDQLSTYPLASLILEMLKFLEKDPMLIHEEAFIVNAFSALNQAIADDDFAQDTDSLWRSGGLMRVSTVIPIIEGWFREDEKTGEKVIARLLPTISQVDFAVFYILFKLTCMKLTAEELFYKLDKRKANNILREDFIEGVKETLGVLLPDEYLDEVSRLLDKTSSNGIFRTEFNDMFQLSRFETDNETEAFRVSRVQVVDALRNAYMEWKSEFSSDMYLEFIVVPNNDHVVSIDDADTLITTIDPVIVPEHLRAFKTTLRSQVGESFIFESFRDCFFQYPFGKPAESFFSIPGLAWARTKVKVSQTVLSILRGRQSGTEASSITSDKADS